MDEARSGSDVKTGRKARYSTHFVSILIAATCLIGAGSSTAIADTGNPDSLAGTWEFVRGGSGEVEFVGGSGSYTGIVREPVTFECTHPAGEALFTFSWTGTGASYMESYEGGELWYTDECKPLSYGHTEATLARYQDVPICTSEDDVMKKQAPLISCL